MSETVETRKFQETFFTFRKNFSDGDLSVSMHLCFDYELCTQIGGSALLLAFSC